MKRFFILILFSFTMISALPPLQPIMHPDIVEGSEKLIIVTLDGVRWQEIFRGADPLLLRDRQFTKDNSSAALFGAENESIRRQLLMPFLWSVVSGRGQLYGNRDLDNRMNVSNLYNFSYPGYHEMFTGNTDLAIASNKKKDNPHPNVLEFLNGRSRFANKTAVFTSWDVFPFILGSKRNGLPVNSGPGAGEHSRSDRQTFSEAMVYIQKEKPEVLFIGLGDMDDHAHGGRYDDYLASIHEADQMLAGLWAFIQSDPHYRGKTSLLISTDHGRGSGHQQWKSHGTFIRGSSQTWMALLGPGIKSIGEMKGGKRLYQQQLAGLIAGLVGEDF